MLESPASHPGDEALLALSLGHLADVDLTRISSHLISCPVCCRRIDQLTKDDGLLVRLKRSAAAQEAVLATPDERLPAVLALRRSRDPGSAAGDEASGAGHLSGLIGVSTGQTNGDPIGPRDLADELTQFLAPAEWPDEIGRLGPYRVLAVLGRGGMGAVFRAHDPALDRLVALKVILPGVAAVPTARDRFLREAKAAAGLKHPHIVTVFQVGEDRGVPFLAMEFLEGEPLDERIRREGPLPLAEVLRIGRETALGLATAHARGLVHRDIKPANLWLEGPAGQVKVLDFGLAHAAADETHLTQFGIIMGTPAYMAPEQAEGEPADPRSDLFSLGCVLYQMTAGTLPYEGKTTIAVLRALALHEPPPLEQVRPETPPELSSLVVRLLAKNPENRLGSAQATADALLTLQQLPAREFRPKPAVRPSRNRRYVMMAAVGAAMLIPLASTAVFWLTSHGTERIETDDPAVKILVRPSTDPTTGLPRQDPTKVPAPANAPFDPQLARHYQTVWAKYLGVPVETTNAAGMKFRLIPPGQFTMGVSDTDARAWEHLGPYMGHGHMAVPAHPVQLTRAFYIGERELRYGDFVDIMNREPGNGPKLNFDKPDGPLTAGCTWLDCIEFCNVLSKRDGLTPAYKLTGQAVTLIPDATGYRLPTEAEWEYACRAGSVSLWHFGLTAQDAEASFDRDRLETQDYLRRRTAERNAFGLFGLYGGAAEWVWDRYRPGYYRDCSDRGVVTDPQGSDVGTERITRGGTRFADGGGDLTLCNSAARNPSDPVTSLGVNGFGRLVLPIPAKRQAGSAIPVASH
jgi:serine/threonine protein kinase